MNKGASNFYYTGKKKEFSKGGIECIVMSCKNLLTQVLLAHQTCEENIVIDNYGRVCDFRIAKPAFRFVTWF